MKKSALLVILFILGVFFVACQKEESELIIEPNDGTITVTSDVTALLLRTAENNGSLDDLIDGFSCGSIVLPVTVFANGQKVTIITEDDLALVVAIFDQFPNDTDVIEIVFPIDIILDDYSQITVNSQAELDALIASCDNLGDDSIDCVDFVYPITLFVYNSELQQIDTVIIESTEEFYQFLSDLNENEFFGIDFPVSVIVNGEVIEVNSNQELEDIINNSDCDSDNPIDNSQFIEYLTTGVWYVTYYFDDYDETGDFEGYEFTFNADKSAQTTNGSVTIPGNWDLLGSSSPKLDLFFGATQPLDNLDDDWEILEGTSEIIRLRDVSGGDGSTDYLTFGRTPNGGGSNGDVNALIEQLTSEVWYISLYNDDGDDDTCDYLDYEFTYFENGSASAVSSAVTKNGVWTVLVDSEGGLDLVLNFEYSGDNDPFEDLNDDWDVEEFSPTYINLKDVSGGGGGTDYLNFGRYPYTDCGGGGGSAQELREIMVDGLWYVHTYLDDGYNETGDYNGYNLNFNAAGNVTASNGSSTSYGTWAITESSGELDFVLDFGSNAPFDEFSDDWDVLAFTTTRVELEDISGGGGGTDTLIFEKL